MSGTAPDTVPKARRSWFIRLTLVFLGLLGMTTGLVVVGSSLIGAAPMFDAVSRVLGVARPYFYLFHCTLIFLVWWYWAPLVERLGARGSMNAPKKAALHGARNHIVLMLVAIEVFVVMGFPFRFLSSAT